MRQKETKQNKIETDSEIFLIPVPSVWCTWLMVKTGDNDIPNWFELSKHMWRK